MEEIKKTELAQREIVRTDAQVILFQKSIIRENEHHDRLIEHINKAHNDRIARIQGRINELAARKNALQAKIVTK